TSPSTSPASKPPWPATGSPSASAQKKESKHELVSRTPEQPRPRNRPTRGHLGHRGHGRHLRHRHRHHRRGNRHRPAPHPPRRPIAHPLHLRHPVVVHRQHPPIHPVRNPDGRPHPLHPVDGRHLDRPVCGNRLPDHRHRTILRPPGRNRTARSPHRHRRRRPSHGHVQRPNRLQSLPPRSPARTHRRHHQHRGRPHRLLGHGRPHRRWRPRTPGL